MKDRFPLPFTFKPTLSAFEAFVGIFASLCRIFLGCLLFASWGVLTLYSWNTWGVLVMLPMVLLFAGALALLMISISFVADRILRLGDGPDTAD
jgi:hypothetical protein